MVQSMTHGRNQNVTGRITATRNTHLKAAIEINITTLINQRKTLIDYGELKHSNKKSISKQRTHTRQKRDIICIRTKQGIKKKKNYNNQITEKLKIKLGETQICEKRPFEKRKVRNAKTKSFKNQNCMLKIGRNTGEINCKNKNFKWTKNKKDINNRNEKKLNAETSPL